MELVGLGRGGGRGQGVPGIKARSSSSSSATPEGQATVSAAEGPSAQGQAATRGPPVGTSSV
jgi:hypothetical protein